MEPTRDVEKLNNLINHPSIREWVCGDYFDSLDAAQLMKIEGSVFFAEDLGGIAFDKKSEDTYECHTFVLPEGRGRWARKKFKEAAQWLFDNTGADKIITQVPANNRMALGAARMCGFKKYDTIEKAWKSHGEVHDVDMYVFHKGDLKCPQQ